MTKSLTVIALVLLLPVIAFAYPTDLNKPEKYITNADIVGHTHWSADTVWVLNDRIFVEDGEVLTIEPGTIVKGEEGQDAAAKTLVVARGGKIYAVGTPCEPIIFTSILDDVWNLNDAISSACDATARGKWGGIVLCGIAPINDPLGYDRVEGIPTDDDRGIYGVGDGSHFTTADPMDNSGTCKYVSVRHMGTQVAEAAEINGWSFAGVGAGTTLSHLEAFFGADDGYEWWGGTVFADHLITAYCDDDMFDMDEGFSGGGQFWFGVQSCTAGDKGGEHDGGGQRSGVADDVMPFANARVSNATYIGRNAQPAFDLRDNFGGYYYNSIFSNWTYGPKIETNTSFTTDSYQRILREQLKFYNCVWYDFGNGNTSDNVCNVTTPGSIQDVFEDFMFNDFDEDNYTAQIRNLNCGAYPATGHGVVQNWKNFLSTGMVINDYGSCCAEGAPDETLDPRGTDLSTTFRNGYAADWHAAGGWADPFNADELIGAHPEVYYCSGEAGADEITGFEAVDYPGAFDPNSNMIWCAPWSALYQYGYLAPSTYSGLDPASFYTSDFGKPEKYITNADITGFTAWSNDTVYVLNDRMFVENDEVLYIEPGTVVKGEEGQDAAAKTLIAARGGRIYAVGTECQPIIFTSILDDVWDLNDAISLACDATARGKWGGIILLGIAPINDPLGYDRVEGIPSDDNRGVYGVGDGGIFTTADPMDNSGVFKYCSVRHMGTQVAEAAEINGWSFAGVGAGTILSHLESFFGADDGYEWWGGTVFADHLITAFCDDDMFDMDEGFAGGGQFWFGIMSCTAGDKGGEHDGGGQRSGVNDDVTPFTQPLMSNVTYIGRNAQPMFDLRDNFGGAYYNSIFTHTTYGPKIETNTSFTTDTYQRVLREQMKFYNCVWHDFGNGNTSDNVCNVTTPGSIQDVLEDFMFNDFDEDNYTAQIRNLNCGTYPTTGHDGVQNWKNFLSGDMVVNSYGSCCAEGAPDGTLDPRATALTCTFRNGYTDDWHTTGGWSDPLDANTLVGFHPEAYGCPGEYLSFTRPYTYQAVDYPGAFDPSVSINDSWLKFSAVYTYGYVDDNPYTETCPSGGCCVGRVGDANASGDDEPTLGDISAIIAALFIQGVPDPIDECFAEADVNQSGGTDPTYDDITLGDIGILISYLFIKGPYDPVTNPSGEILPDCL